MRVAIFPLHLSKALRLPGKSDARSYEVLHLSRKIILANLQIRCSKMQPLSGNQHPDLLTSLMNMSFVLRCTAPATRYASLQILFKCPTPAIVCGNATESSRSLTFDKVHNPLRLPRETSPNPWCFVHFDFEMCFAPQRPALFRHLNFQNWSGAGVLCTF